MKNLIESLQVNDAETLNGAVTHSTSLNANLDLFFLAGASRRMEPEMIIHMFMKAYSEDPLLAFTILLWARDCRGGAGERRFFQIICKYLENNKMLPSKVSNSIDKYGYWKDYFEICDHNDHSHIQYLADFFIQKEVFEFDSPIHDINLLAKWFPRKGPWFVKMHKELDMTPKDFRKLLVKLTNVVETKMCNKEFEDIEYSHVPSIAMHKYRNAFIKHDGERFNTFIQSALKDPKKINASVLFPHVLCEKMFEIRGKSEVHDAIQAQWQALPNYMEGSNERILPLCDVSGSMTGLPMMVSVSLGLYISERNESVFKNAFLTFSEKPQLCYVEGKTLFEKLNSIQNASWGFNTNLLATFDLILNKATDAQLPQDEMPTKLLIISDMEFDQAEDNKTNLDSIKEKYEKSGYKMPEIIFWNVNGRVGNIPANKYDSKVGLVSGFSPAILKSILLGEVETPTQLMLRTVNNGRYDIYLEEDLHSMDLIDDDHYVWSLPRYSESK